MGLRTTITVYLRSAHTVVRRWTVFMLLLGAVPAFGEEARVVALEVIAGGRVGCSATFLNILSSSSPRQTACHLVSTRHCFPNDLQSLSIRLTTSSRRDLGLKSSPALEPLFADGTKDLIALEAPPEVRNRACAGLTPIDPSVDSAIALDRLPRADVFGAYSAVGNSADRIVTVFPGGASEPDGRLTYARLVPALAGVANLVQVPGLRLVPGMSGGALVNGNGQFFGITVSRIEFQHEAHAIPFLDVLEFVNSSIAATTSSLTRQARLEHLKKQRSLMGENVHADTDDRPRSVDDSSSPLAPFREPDEGWSPSPGTKKVLGARVEAAFFQIDGERTYLRHAGRNDAELISRPRDGFPDVRIRQRLFERLRGSFASVAPGRALFHELTAGGPSLLDLEGDPGVGVAVIPGAGGASAQIEVLIGGFVYQRADGFDAGIGESPQERLLFEARFGQDANEIVLEGRDVPRLRCANRHLLKLICTGDGVELSLSLTDTVGGPMRVRLTRMYNDGNRRPIVRNVFHELRKVRP